MAGRRESTKPGRKDDVQTGSKSFAQVSDGLRADAAGKPARRACAILGLHLCTFASGWLACLKDKELSPRKGRQAALRRDRDGAAHQPQPHRALAAHAGLWGLLLRLTSDFFPSWVSICPFLMQATLSGRQASLGVAMVMVMMSPASKSNHKPRS